MTIEVATWITDLQPLNPPSTDPRGQGDDHLRLIKLVLQDTFPTASKAFYNPTSVAKSANFSVLAADMNKTFLVDTTAGIVTMTLPTLASGDAGWECFLLKTNTGTNPVLVAPATGTLNSGEYAALAAARRCIPGRRTQCLWTGTVWFISRVNTLPVTSLIKAQGTGLPVGYEYPNGQTLGSVATNYPELNLVLGSGVLIDVRGRGEIALDNLGGSAAGRVGTIIVGTAIGNTGGTETVGLLPGNIPNLTTPVTISVSAGGAQIPVVGGSVGNFNASLTGGSNASLPFVTVGAGAWSGVTSLSGGTVTGTSNNTSGSGTGNTHSNLPASIIVNEFMIVE